MSCKPRLFNKFISFAGVALGGAVTASCIGIYRGDEKLYSNILMPFVSRFIDPENAHELCILFTKYKLINCRDNLTPAQASLLRTKVFNLGFSNPIGLAAGFDKSSKAIEGLPYYGLGFAEVGTVTPMPQVGNPKKRIFRIRQDKALINRCGFNNEGIDFVTNRLSTLKADTTHGMLVGLNLGKNKSTQHLTSDYLIGLEKSQDLDVVNYLVINISSPNTPGLRDTQDKRNLEVLVDDLLAKMEQLSIKKPLLVKVAPDLTDGQIKDIADIITSKRNGSSRISGIILTNTTISRPNCDKQPDSKTVYDEAGGLSGMPLRDMSTRTIGEFYKHIGDRVPIIGVGGISSGQDAYDKIKAGASLVQLYTGITYEGPPLINRIKRELVELLEKDKLSSVSDAVGLEHRQRSANLLVK